MDFILKIECFGIHPAMRNPTRLIKLQRAIGNGEPLPTEEHPEGLTRPTARFFSHSVSGGSSSGSHSR